MTDRRSPILPQALVHARPDVTDEQRAQLWTTKSIVDPTQSIADSVRNEIAYSDIEDDISRAYRMREALRIARSYNTAEQQQALVNAGYDLKLIESVENYRLTQLANRIGVNSELLTSSPMHKDYGQRVAKIGTPDAFAALGNYMPQLFDSKSLNQFLSGVRASNPDWAKKLREIAKHTLRWDSMQETPVEILGNAQPSDMSRYKLPKDVKFPGGFQATLELAKDFKGRIDSEIASMKARASLEKSALKGKSSLDPTEAARLKELMDKFEEDGGEISSIPGELELPGKGIFPTGGAGEFAELYIDETVRLTKTVSGYLHRRKRSNYYGKRVLYPSRMLTDPMKRVFGEKVKAPGGVVIIDVSGSMSLTDGDVNEILKAAPGAYVAAYSHGREGKPNFTVLANRGKQVESIPNEIFRGGNGVDGPAIVHGLRQRRKNEPLIWICDGMVTSAGDGTSPVLDQQVAELVVRYGIVQIPNVPMAIEQLKTRRFKPIYAGAVGDVIRKSRRGLH